MGNSWQYDIDYLMIRYNQKVRRRPENPTDQEVELRRKLIQEEVKELDDAMCSGNLPEVAKELVDVLVVTIGAASSWGIDLDPIWNLVHESNLAKAGGPKDPQTGKQLKPPGWQKPDIKTEIERQQNVRPETKSNLME